MGRQTEGYISHRIAVPADFKNIFSHFYIAGNHTGEDIVKTLLPSFQTIMAFSFGAPVQFSSGGGETIVLEKCIVLGPVKQAIQYRLPVGADLLVVNFTEDAFFRFFGKVILSDHIPFNPDDIVEDNCFTGLWNCLRSLPPDQRADTILNFCRPYIAPREDAFNHFIQTKLDYTLLNPIKVIAGQIRQSERMVQLNHKKYFGYSAKEKARYEKFIKAIHVLSSYQGKVNWFDIIDSCGYYDQSQLIHDFKHFLNLSPNKYLEFQADVCRAGPI